MENPWQGGASGSRGYHVNYTPGIDLTGPYYERPPPPPYERAHPHPYERPPPHPYHQRPGPHPYDYPPQPMFQQPPPTAYEQPAIQPPFQQAGHPVYENPASQPSDEQGVETNDDTEKRKRRDKNYDSLEDETLCSAWLNISRDCIVGTSQGTKAFWSRIREYFNEHRRTTVDRSSGSLQHRWGDIKREAGYFTGFYSEIERLNQSGKSEDDKIKDALQSYEGRYNRQFKFLHCWLILRREPKWAELLAGPSESSRQERTEGQPSVPTTAPARMERPMGRDRAKKQRSSSGGSNSTACYEMLQKMQVDRANFEEYMKAANKDECEAMSSRSDMKLQFQAKQLELQTRSTVVQEKMYTLHEKEREDRIMGIDLDKMTPWAREYYMNQQKSIVAKSHSDVAAQTSTSPHQDL